MSWLSDWSERARAVVFRRREERDFADETRFHIDMEVERLRQQGVPEAEARRQGRLAFGNVGKITEDVRDARGTQGVARRRGDLHFAVRTLRRSPGFVAVAVLILSLGIGGITAVFSVVDAVLLRPLPYREPGQLVRLYQGDTLRPADRGFVTPVHYLAYREQLRSFTALAAAYTYEEVGADIGTGDDARRLRVLPVSREYFDALGVRPALGRGFTADEERDAPVVILSHRLWQERFDGDPALVGRAITMRGIPRTVVGIAPEGLVDPLGGLGIEAWVPLDLSDGRDETNVDNHYLSMIGRIGPGVSLARAQGELNGLGRTLAERWSSVRQITASLYPLKEEVVGSSRQSLGLMFGAVGLVLLLVCVNIANLMLVRSTDRAKEFAVRSALGASRGRLVGQLLTESLVLAMAGALGGLLVGRLAMSAIVALAGDAVPRLNKISLDPRVLGFAVAVAAVSAIVFGLAPAWRAGRADPADVLRRQTRSGTGDHAQQRVRNALVISQVALAFVLVVGAGLLLESFRRLQEVPLGVTTDRVFTFYLDLPGVRYDSTARGAFHENLARALEAVPGVRAAGAVSKLPATGPFHSWGTRAITGPTVGTPNGFVQAQQRVIAGHYFQAMGITLLAGRAFDERDVVGTPHRVIVTKQLADAFFPKLEAVGQQIRMAGITTEIIGVAPDVAIDAEGHMAPTVYHSHTQYAGDRNWPMAQVVATTGPAAAVFPAVRRTVAGLDPQLVVDRPAPLPVVVGAGVAQRAFTMRILLTFAGVALLLAAIGLFGVLSYVVRLRTAEFGIRMALGARRDTIRAMVLRQGLTVTVWGIACGLVGVVVVSRIMTAMVFGVSPFDPRVVASAIVVSLLVAAIASYLPAYRATTVDPRQILQ